MEVTVTQDIDGLFTIKIGNQTITKIPKGYMVRLRNALNQELSK